MNSGNFIFEDQTEWVQLNEMTRRKVLGYDEKMMLVKIEFKARGIGYAHQHEHRQCTIPIMPIWETTTDGLPFRIIRMKTGKILCSYGSNRIFISRM